MKRSQYYFISVGTDIDPSDCQSETCSEVSHSLADDGVKHPVVSFQEFA